MWNLQELLVNINIRLKQYRNNKLKIYKSNIRTNKYKINLKYNRK